jgi:hypothetical protein
MKKNLNNGHCKTVVQFCLISAKIADYPNAKSRQWQRFPETIFRSNGFLMQWTRFPTKN